MNFSNNRLRLCKPKHCFFLVLTMILSFVSTSVFADDTTEPALNDGYYQISTAAQLKWFADKVNAGNEEINGVLTEDIDLSELGTEYWVPIGLWSTDDGKISMRRYRGKFNGQNHFVYGLVLRKTAASGLFGYAYGATISNVIIRGVQMKTTRDTSVASEQYGIGAICGVADSGTLIDNCHSTRTEINYFIDDSNQQKEINCVGGIVGELRYSTAKNCSTDGFVRTDGQAVGGIAGAINSAQVENCQLKVIEGGSSKIVGLAYVGGIAGFLRDRTTEKAILNCTVADGSEILANGKVDSTTGDTLFLCNTICGYDSLFSEPGQYDGYYEIYTADQLKWFANKVNGGTPGAKAKLMNDINMSKAGTFTPIGTDSKKFSGTFDGQGYTIDSLTINGQKYAGLFGYVADGEIKNVNLHHPYISTSNDYLGFLAGFLTQEGGAIDAAVENCHVTDAVLDGAAGKSDYVGGIVGKADMSAVIKDCSFQGTIKPHDEYVGGIAGELNSGAKIYSSMVVGPSTVWGDNYVGGVVGYMVDDATKIDNCYADQSTGTVAVHASTNNYSGMECGYNKSGSTTNTKYNEGNLQYEFTGKKVKVGSNEASEMRITGVSTTGKGEYYAIVDIGTSANYFTTEINNLQGVEELYFWDNCSNIAGTEACGWINMKIDDYAFDSSFKKLKMYYKIFAGDDHIIMLRPTDVYPAGDHMLDNCDDAKVYVDAEYYEAFCNDSNWSKYKKYLVPVTWMRTEDVNAEHGARYAYDRNPDETGSVVKNGSVSQLHVIGIDDNYVNSDNDNTLWIYQDIGETYDYNTTKIWASSFNGKDEIKQVKFQAITKSASRPSQAFHIEIGDSAFANCKNLNSFNVALYSDEDKDHVELLHPKDLPLGKGVFDNCPNLKIIVDNTLLSEFRNDTIYGWGVYKNNIIGTDYAWNSFEEDGVYYGYYTSEDGQTRYTNKNEEEMEAKLLPLVSELNYFKPSSVLCPDNSSTIYYMVATGLDNTASDIEDGTLNIYNDIGNAYNYKTIALSASGFRGNTQIKSVMFTDCAGNNGNAKADLSLVIPSGAFEGCSELREFNMFQYITKGSNHYESIKPSQIFIGKDVFKGVHKDFRIKVLPGLYEDFINDPNWKQYKDFIIATDYVPVDKDDKKKDDVTYGYATNTLNTLATSQVVKLQSSLWNVPIVIAETVMFAYDIYGVLSAFGVPAKVAEAGAKRAALNTYNKAISSFLEGNYSFDNVIMYGNIWAEGEQYGSIVDAAGKQIFFPKSVLGNTFEDELVQSIVNTYLEGIKDAIQVGISTKLASAGSFLNSITTSGVTETYANVLSYLTNRAAKTYENNPSWYVNGLNWVSVSKRSSATHMYVKDVPNQESVRLYVDIGDKSNHYQTVAIGRTAFHDKDKIQEIHFSDKEGMYYPMEPLMLTIPDSCFSGCKSLNTLDLVITSNGARWGLPKTCQHSLSPDNFLLTGDIFAGLDSISRSKIQILVGNDMLQEFQEDAFWGKYKSMLKGVDVTPVELNKEHGCKYTYSFDNNTMPYVTQTSENEEITHVEVYAPDDSSIKDGMVALINDYGLTNNYQLDGVSKKAFMGNKSIKTLDFTDSQSNIGDVYTDFSITLQDSAFANCTNLRDVNLVYQVTDDINTTKTLSPTQVKLGKDVFLGCDSLRLKICLDQEEAFYKNLSWLAYANNFCPCLFVPHDYRISDLLWKNYKFYTSLNGEQSGKTWKYIDVTRMKPEDLKTIFYNGIFRDFDEFRVFDACGLTQIYDNMFAKCIYLQSITLPESITSIGSKAFSECPMLPKLTIPASVTSIGDEAFSGSSIKEFFVENPVPADINVEKAFSGLTYDKDYIIYVADSVETLYKQKWAAVSDHINALSKHSNLKVINLTKEGTLKDSLGLVVGDPVSTDVRYVSGMMAQYDSLRISGPLNGEDILVLRNVCGRNIRNEENYTGRVSYLDLSGAELRKSDFCYNTQPVDNADEWIHNCYIDEDDYIGRYMFSGLVNVKTLILPNSATKIETKAFDGCSKLETLVVGEKVTTVDDKAAVNCPKAQYLVMLPDKAPSAEQNSWSFHGTVSTSGVVLPLATVNSNYTRILLLTSPKALGGYFRNTAYTSYTADSICSLFQDEAVFKAMAKKHVYTPVDLAALTRVNGCVNGNTDVKEFNELLISAVDTLDDKTLTNMSGMKEFTLPAGLKHITADAFKGCLSLDNVNALCDECPTLEKSAFVDLPEDFTITVLEGYEDKYRKAWPEYANHIKGYRPELKVREVTLKEMNTLADSLDLRVFMDGDDVSSIGGSMSGITALKVNGPLGSKDVAVLRMLAGREPEWDTQSYATNLKYLNLYDAEIKADKINFTTAGFDTNLGKDNVIPKKFLKNCYNLETVILPKTVTKISDEAFYNMYSLKTLVLGDDLNDVDGDDAFGESHALTKMIFLCDKKPELHHDAFTDPIDPMDDNYKVENMYVKKSINDDYTKDYQYSDHASHITSVFSNDDLFRAYGSRGVATEDDLESISNITGWFGKYDGITDLSSLRRSTITKFNASDVDNLTSLQHVSLPSTITELGDGTFSGNAKLTWVDLSECDSVTNGVNISNLGIAQDALVYAPSSATPESTPAQAKTRRVATASSQSRNTVNTVYNVGGELVCDDYQLPTDRDYDVPKAFTAKKVTLSRNFTPQSYTTLTLPFDIKKVPSGFKFFKLNSTSEEEEIGVNRAYSTEASIPYLVWVEKDKMTIDGDTKVQATTAAKSVSNTFYSMWGTFNSISNADAIAAKTLVCDSKTTLWNLLGDDNTADIEPFTAYVNINKTTSDKDVPTKFLDPQYFYSVGEAKHMLDGDGVEIPLTTDDMTLIDGQDFKADKAFTASEATYSREMNTRWGTLCLPYAIEADGNETCEFYEMTDNSNNTVTLKKLTGIIDAGRPVVVRRRSNDTSSTVVINASETNVVADPVSDNMMTGSFVYKELTPDAYIISNDKFWLIGDKQKAKMKAYRSYVNNSTGSKAATLGISIDDGTTAIDELNEVSDGANAEYYDIRGLRHDNLQKGVNIIKNGNRSMKVIIK